MGLGRVVSIGQRQVILSELGERFLRVLEDARDQGLLAVKEHGPFIANMLESIARAYPPSPREELPPAINITEQLPENVTKEPTAPEAEEMPEPTETPESTPVPVPTVPKAERRGAPRLRVCGRCGEHRGHRAFATNKSEVCRRCLNDSAKGNAGRAWGETEKERQARLRGEKVPERQVNTDEKPFKTTGAHYQRCPQCERMRASALFSGEICRDCAGSREERHIA